MGLVIHINNTLKDALQKLDANPAYLTLFVANEVNQIIGSITDGDIRRGLLKDLNNSSKVSEFYNPNFTYIVDGEYNKNKLDVIKKKGIKIVPVLDNKNKLIKVLNFDQLKTILPMDAVIMAGGKGTRLRPLTKTTPKPLLKIGNKPIIEYNIDRLKKHGIFNQYISINYLGDQLIEYFKDGKDKDISITYIKEDVALGTIGAIRKVQDFKHEYILVMNSDILTDIDFENLFYTMENSNADMIVSTTSYKVEVPYGVIETNKNHIVNLIEKPTYTYYSNAGIYIIKKEHLALIPDKGAFNATDLMQKLIDLKKNVIHFPITGYWLDIGKHKDFEKAQMDIKHLKL